MAKPNPPEDSSHSGDVRSSSSNGTRWGSSEQVGLGELVRTHSDKAVAAVVAPSVTAESSDREPDDSAEANTLTAKLGDTARGRPESIPSSEPNPTTWPRLKAELQEFHAWEVEAWRGVDEHLLAKYLAGQCSDDERRRVEKAAEESEYVRDCLQLVEEVLADEAAKI